MYFPYFYLFKSYIIVILEHEKNDNALQSVWRNGHLTPT